MHQQISAARPLGSAPGSLGRRSSRYMRDSVSRPSKSFSTKFGGYLRAYMVSVKNIITTGMGNLVDPVGQATGLPWVNSDGSAATQAQITAAWNAVKARTDLNQKGGKAYASVTTIRLTDAGIDQLIQSRLQSNETILKKNYPGFDNWPADAASWPIHSMAWAMGPAFKFPKFAKDVNADPPDFTSAATDGQMNATGNRGLVPRNTANNKLFLNAATAVLKNKADPDKLYYPGRCRRAPRRRRRPIRTRPPLRIRLRRPRPLRRGERQRHQP